MFSSAYTVDNGILIDFPPRIDSSVFIESVIFTPFCINAKLQRLKRSLTINPDTFPPILLQSCAHQLSIPLSLLFSPKLLILLFFHLVGSHLLLFPSSKKAVAILFQTIVLFLSPALVAKSWNPSFMTPCPTIYFLTTFCQITSTALLKVAPP